MKTIYLLKDIARKSGQSVHTIKYYLKLGIIQEIGRSPDTHFRFFDDSTLKRLQAIRDLRLQGHSLKTIKVLLDQSGVQGVREVSPRGMQEKQ